MWRGGTGACLAVALLCLLGGLQTAYAAERIRHVIVIAMENANAFAGSGNAYIYGNMASAPYINGALMPRAARSDHFIDPLPLSVPSEAHYVFMEAGTNTFSDFTFGGGPSGDSDPSAKRSTSSKNHLAAQIEATRGRVSWSAYQEGLGERSGSCPVNSDHANGYAAKHNPFVFFQDVAGSPPSKGNPGCARHMKSLESLGSDLKHGRLADYVFITPSLCHDMHNLCGAKSRVAAGDVWLQAQMPAILSYVQAHSAVVFLVWDEGKDNSRIPFLALGPSVRHGHASAARFDHRSLIKTIERIFGLPQLATVKEANDLADLFQADALP